jgi:hypothetical protein
MRAVKKTSFPMLAIAFAVTALLAPASAQAVPPQVLKTTVSKVSTDAATLGALVNPQGQAGSFHFEYGPADCSISACALLPEETFPTNTSPEPVETALGGLTAGTTYHLRVVVKNLGGEETVGPDRVFATYAPAFEGLPDGRAFEQASPVKKNAADARGMVSWAKAAEDGSRISFLSTSGLPGGVGEQDVPAYLASRGAADWSTQALLPEAALASRAFVRGWLSDLSTVFEEATTAGTNQDSLFLARSSADGSFSQVLGEGDGLGTFSYAGASADGSEVLFEAGGKLSCCPQALADKPNLYLWDRDAAQIKLVSVLNDEEPPAQGAVAGPYDWMRSANLPLSAVGGGPADGYYTQDTHVISAEGDAIYFTAGSGALYVRLNPTASQSPLSAGKCVNPALACTLLVSASQRTQPDPVGERPAAFMTATPDGKTTFFASPEKLTDDANTGPVQPPPAIQRAKATGPPIEEELPGIIASGIAKDAEHLYWASSAANTIGRSGLKGENPDAAFIEIPPLKVKNAKEEIEDVPAKPQYVAVDAGHVYWSSEGEGKKTEGVIGRADINISGEPANIKAEWIKGISRPKGIALDSEFIYWAQAGEEFSNNEGAIGRAKKSDGGEVLGEFAPIKEGTERPQGVAVDTSDIYWTSNNSNGGAELLRVDIANGTSNLEFHFLGEDAQARGVALDAEHVYWASQGEEAIGRMPIADFTQAGSCKVIPSCNPKFIPTTGKPIGLTADGAELRWSVNGEVVPNPGNDLYRYQAQGEALEDVTAGGPAPNGAEVKGVLGASADAERVYFAANGDLDGAGEAQAGNCRGSFFAFTGRCSLYLAQKAGPNDWSITFIAALDTAEGDCETSAALDWLARGGTVSGNCRPQKTARVSADGATLLFVSNEQLGAYDNEGQAELYRYGAGADQLRCVSCNPTGEAPAGSVRLGSIGLTTFTPEREPSFLLSRNLSADGNRVFFETPDPLVANDANGKAGCEIEGSGFFPLPSCQDVYEWEAAGSGSCPSDAQGGGCHYLLSTGTSPNGSSFADASLSGDDAFLATRSAGLVRQDQDELQDIYDARVGGGLAAQNQAPAPQCESLDGCHGPQSPQPASQSPPTANLGGQGNQKHPRKHAKKKKHKKQKKHKKHHKTGGRSR